jgi:hypothetical protein
MRHRLTLAIALALALAGAAAHAQQPADFKLGLNLGQVNYWARNNVCSDLLDPVVAIYPPRVPGVAYDDLGWPRALGPNQNLSWITPGSWGYLPAGRYRVTCKGSGRIHFGHPTARAAVGPKYPWIDVKATGPDSTTTVLEYDVPADEFNVRSLIGIFGTDPTNHLRELKWSRVGDDVTRRITDRFLDTVKGYQTLRFVNWMEIPGNRETTWPAFAGTPGGRPDRWEQAIAASTRAGVAPWFCLPHAANDNYLTQLGTLTRNTLRKDLPVYLEYSVECWNWGPPFVWETSYCNDFANAQTPKISREGGYAKLAAHAFDAFQAADPSRRCVRVLASQFGYPYLADLCGSEARRFGLRFDVLAGAPYVNSTPDFARVDALLLAGSTEAAVDEIIRGFRLELVRMQPLADQWTAISKKYSLPLVAYECGPSWNVPQPAATATDAVKATVARRTALHAIVQRSPKLGTFLLEEYFPWLARNGFTLGNYYCGTSPGVPGSEWGYNDHIGEASPKVDACRAWIRLHPSAP